MPVKNCCGMSVTVRRYKKIIFYVLGAVGLALICIIAVSFVWSAKRKDVNYTVYIGGYGPAITKGSFNSRTLEFTRLAEMKMDNPSYLSFVSSGKRLYAVSEVDDNSGVSGFDNQQLINSRSDIGWGPCYITYHKGHLFTANYGDGSISVFPLDSAWRIKPSTQLIKFAPDRSDPLKRISRIHTVRILRSKESGNDYLLATDMGADRLYFFRIMKDEERQADGSNLDGGQYLRLAPCDTSYYEVPAGYGPRQVAFSNGGRFMYLLCQTSGMIIVYTVGESDNNIILRRIQEIEADPYKGAASGDIAIHPSGHYLYASNRKVRDGISIFRILENGTLMKYAYQLTAPGPRQFSITRDGDLMFVACQQGGVVQVFRIDKRSGFLEKAAKDIVFQNLQPSCVLVNSQ